MNLTFLLNGETVQTVIDPAASLLETLRACGIHSVRQGCDTENCGICTVWVNETPVLSCSYPAARAEGKRVTTIEGAKDEAKALMDALAAEGADQCGFCAPGFLMSALAMLRELPDPSEEDIRRYLAGNLCRCTGYASQARALRRVYEKREAGK